MQSGHPDSRKRGNEGTQDSGTSDAEPASQELFAHRPGNGSDEDDEIEREDLTDPRAEDLYASGEDHSGSEGNTMPPSFSDEEVDGAAHRVSGIDGVAESVDENTMAESNFFNLTVGSLPYAILWTSLDTAQGNTGPTDLDPKPSIQQRYVERVLFCKNM